MIWVFLIFLVAVAVGLVIADDVRKHGRTRNRELRAENTQLRALIHDLGIEAGVQIAAGNQAFEYVQWLISTETPTPPKELP